MPGANQSVGRCVRYVLLALLVALVYVVFSPLLGYFFAQDDFRLIDVSTTQLGVELSKTFGANPYHVRPLTKHVYFAATYPLFGLRPLPYHLLSLLVHMANLLMVYLLLRRMRINFEPAIISASFFGLSVAFFHAIGWISCIQQLAGTFFLLLSVVSVTGSDAGTRARYLWLSAAAYLAALLSVEQTFLLPVLLSAIYFFGLLRVDPLPLRKSLGRFWPHYGLLVAYITLRLWKGVPDAGRTEFHFGKNIVENIVVYLGAMYDMWPDVGNVISIDPLAPTSSHAVLAMIVLYNLVRRRIRAVVFALAFILAMLLPTFFLFRHHFYYHTYISSFGSVYLVALVLQDVTWLSTGSVIKRVASIAVILLVVASASTLKVRDNIERAKTGDSSKPSSFLIRRAVVAERFYHCIRDKASDIGDIRRVYVLWGTPEIGVAAGQSREVEWALGHGHAVRLFLNRDVEVTMSYTTPKPPHPSTDTAVLFYDHTGMCYTYDEVVAR